MRWLGADCLVVAMKRGNARGAKGAGHRHCIRSTVSATARRNPINKGRRQPSRGGTSRMNREVHVRICERLGVQFPGADSATATDFKPFDFMSAFINSGHSSHRSAATTTFLPIGLALVRVFHLGERNPGVLFTRILEVEGVACARKTRSPSKSSAIAERQVITKRSSILRSSAAIQRATETPLCSNQLLSHIRWRALPSARRAAADQQRRRAPGSRL